MCQARFGRWFRGSGAVCRAVLFAGHSELASPLAYVFSAQVPCSSEPRPARNPSSNSAPSTLRRLR
jgi:hypothetical protein